jgi:hypothetical protein
VSAFDDWKTFALALASMKRANESFAKFGELLAKDMPKAELEPNREPIVAWRAWRVVQCAGGFERGPEGFVALKPGLRLQAWVNPYVWPTGAPAVANCTHGGPSLRSTCSCGIHAHKTREECLKQLANELQPGVFAAYGRVNLWGKWVEGEKGWRAEYAYPYDIYLVDCADKALIREMADVYAVDVDGGPAPFEARTFPAKDFTGPITIGTTNATVPLTSGATAYGLASGNSWSISAYSYNALGASAGNSGTFIQLPPTTP